MPPGLAALLSTEELPDLVAYLQAYLPRRKGSKDQ